MEKEKGLEVTEESDWNVNVQHNGRGIKAHEFIWQLLLKGISASNGLKWSRQKNAVRSSHNKGDLQQQLVTKEELKELNLFSLWWQLQVAIRMLLHRTEADGKRKRWAPNTVYVSSSPELSGEGAGSCAGMGSAWRAKGFDNPLVQSAWSVVPCNAPLQLPGRDAVAGTLCGSLLDKCIETCRKQNFEIKLLVRSYVALLFCKIRKQIWIAYKYQHRIYREQSCEAYRLSAYFFFSPPMLWVHLEMPLPAWAENKVICNVVQLIFHCGSTGA